MNQKILAIMLSAAAIVPLAVTADVLPEDSFWNRETVYAEPTPASASATLDSGKLETSTAWDCVIVFPKWFISSLARPLVLIFR